MREWDIGEWHIYGGLALLAAGLGIWLNNVGVGLAVFGLGMIPIGVLLAATAEPEQAQAPDAFDALKTAQPEAVPDEEVA